jgi:ABC-type sulfate transport system substrate-binding protein
MSQKRWLIFPIFTSAFIAVVLVITSCQPSPLASGEPVKRTMTIYAFSVEEEVMVQEILPAFETLWKKVTRETVVFRSDFAASEEIVDAILNDAPVQIAVFSNEQHAVWLQINDYIETDWRAFPKEGVVSYSPVVIVVRPGNPLKIQDWADLACPGVRLVHANPRTSGGAQWALLAEYGSAYLATKERAAGRKQLEDIWFNVVSSPSSSRDALKEFLFGVGDALVTYEQDALLALSRGATFEIVTPQRTIMSEHVVTIVDRNVDQWDRELVNVFTDFLWSDTAQKAFGRYYFRPASAKVFDGLIENHKLKDEGAPFFSTVELSFTASDIGGWEWAYPEIIQGIWEEDIAPRLSALLELDR